MAESLKTSGIVDLSHQQCALSRFYLFSEVKCQFSMLSLSWTAYVSLITNHQAKSASYNGHIGVALCARWRWRSSPHAWDRWAGSGTSFFRSRSPCACRTRSPAHTGRARRRYCPCCGVNVVSRSASGTPVEPPAMAMKTALRKNRKSAWCATVPEDAGRPGGAGRVFSAVVRTPGDLRRLGLLERRVYRVLFPQRWSGSSAQMVVAESC
jgi:hypothetical protein